MPHYLALIHKERDSTFGVSFPDVPGVIAAADSLDTALSEAAEALAFAAEDWEGRCGSPFPHASTLDALRDDPQFIDRSSDAVVAAVPLTTKVGETA